MNTTMKAVSFAALLALAGCSSFSSAIHFKAAALSGAAKGKSALLMYGAGTASEPTSQLSQAIAAEPGLASLLESGCPAPKPATPQPMLGAALVPIVAALAEAGFNIWAEKQQRKIEEIVSAAQASYSLTISIPPADLDRVRCVLFVRYTEDDNKKLALGLVAVLKLHAESPAPGGRTRLLTMSPAYVRLYNAVAVTQDATEPTASVSLAVSIKAVGRQDAQIERLLASGEGVVTVPDVKLGEKAAARCTDGSCKRSDLVPYPSERGTLSFTLAVTEQGTTGFDDKAALAELAAVKAALGPAIGEAVKAKLGD